MWSGYSGAKKPPANVSTAGEDSHFPKNFFEALNQANHDDALRHLRAEAMEPDGTPSPRTMELVNSGTNPGTGPRWLSPRSVAFASVVALASVMALASCSVVLALASSSVVLALASVPLA